MSFVPLFSVTPPVNSVMSSPFNRAIRCLSSRFRFRLDRLVNGHRLVAGQHMLDTANRRVLPGDGDARFARVDARALQSGDDRTGQAVIGGEYAGDIAFRSSQICSKMTSASWLSQLGTAWSSTSSQEPSLKWGSA